MPHRRIVDITPGRHPFQVAIVAACPLVAITILLSSREPRSLDNALPAGFVNVWLAAIAVNGLIALVGMYWRHPLGWGLMVECGGIIGLGAMVSVYCAAIAALAGLDALASGGLITGIAIACWWRAGQLIRDIRRLRHARVEIRPVVEHRLVYTDDPDPGGRT